MNTIKAGKFNPVHKGHTWLNTAVRVCLALWLSGLALTAKAQVTATDGNWAAKQAALTNTPQAAFMARVGDIDNMGFGWPVGFDPFSGESTPSHDYPWTADPADPSGTDRIMVVSSFASAPPCGLDGYTSYTTRPDNNVRPIVLAYALPPISITNAVFQIFVDDFQAPVWCASYQVYLNGRRAGFLEAVVNLLDQTGPIGKLITVVVPASFLGEIPTGRLEFKIDDPTTGAGDGYSIDFIKLLVNVKSLPSGNVTGHVRDAQTQQPLSGAKVAAYNSATTTDANGLYTLTNVPAGLAYIEASAAYYSPSNQLVDVLMGQTATGVDFYLQRAPVTLSIAPAVELRFFGWSGKSYMLQYSSDFATWYNDETIAGTGAEVVRFRLATAPYRFWRVKQL